VNQDLDLYGASSHTQNPGSRILEWILDPRSWIQDPGSRFLDTGSRILGVLPDGVTHIRANLSSKELTNAEVSQGGDQEQG